MRFCELGLERYGEYEELTVPINGPGLNVIYGPNEAGKSTCLAAITDFLFGIPNNSSYGQRYGYNVMRVRAKLSLPDGRCLDLRRRKGHERTLSDSKGKPVDESVLHRLLPNLSRERFGTLFGLGHETLRDGGRNLLEAEGDIGHLILEAGGGLRTLVDRIRELDEEADQLFATRRSERRKFYNLYDRFAEAARDIREGTLTFETYQQATENLTRTESNYRQLTDTRVTLEKCRSERERASRVMPLLAQLDQIECELESYADVSHLRAAFANEVQESLRARRQAGDLLEDAANRSRTLERQIDDLLIDQSVLSSEAEIRTISERATHVKTERDSRPNRERELTEEQAKLATLRRLLNLEPDEDLKDHVVSGEAQEGARQLASQGRTLREHIATLERRIEENQHEFDLLAEKRRHLQENGFDRALTIQLPRADTLLRLLREIATRRRRAGEVEEDVNRYLSKWGFSGIEEMRNLSCPGADVVDAEIERRKALQQQVESHEENLRQTREKLLLAGKAIERLQAAGEVPTDAAIDRVRSVRKSAWEPIRSAYLSEAPETICGIPLLQRESNVSRLEDRTEEADRLADRKSAEAQRLTDLAAAEKDRDDAAIMIGSLQDACGEVRGTLTNEAMRLEQAWPQALGKEHELTRLRELIKGREMALMQAAETSGLREEAEERQAEADRAISSLSQAEADLRINPTHEGGIPARVHALELSNNAYSMGHREWLQNSARHSQLETQLAKWRTDLAELKEKFTQWREKWQNALQYLGLPVGSDIDFVERVLAEWPRAQTSLALIENIQHRLDQFDHDQDDLAARIAAVSPRFRFQLPDEHVAAANMLDQRLDEARGLETQRHTLLAQKVEADEDHGRKKRRVDELNLTVGKLCEEAKVDEASLQDAAGRLQELIRIRQSRAQKLEEIRTAGDGKSIDELRDECGGLDPDGLRAELEGIRTEKERLEKEIPQAYAAIKTQERDLQQFTAAAGVNAAEARRQGAAAEMRAVIERYLEVRLARELLNQAIDRLREERQDPLIVRAGQLFSLATRGSYAGIATDIDDRGVPVVVGKRPAGEDVHVEVMSDGTRDQLFLAFRIASVEQYCKQSGPIPFIADDLLVHFDDERSAAALELLAELGCDTQVLLFTHHRSVRETADRVLRPGALAITDLPL